MNDSNLISLAARIEEDRRRIAAMGGKASGEARRKKRELINAEKIRQAAERELNTEEIRELRKTARYLRISLKHEVMRPMKQRPVMPSAIPEGYWDE